MQSPGTGAPQAKKKARRRRRDGVRGVPAFLDTRDGQHGRVPKSDDAQTLHKHDGHDRRTTDRRRSVT
eukprot:scaffold66923_cov65-Phaeocystis_antarctica.AAC.1